MRAEITVLLIDNDTNICNVKFCVVKHKVYTINKTKSYVHI